MIVSMDRKPQQQTLSIRVSDALREFLERSKHVISSGRGESVSTSDVAKILLESAKDDRLDVRLEVADMGRKPTESLVEIRKKWEAGRPTSRAEWIFLAQYIEAACDKLTVDPMAPGPEPFITLLHALLAVRTLRTHKGAGLDLYYLSNLLFPCPWNERNIHLDVVPEVFNKLIEEIRTTGNWTKISPVGKNFYVAIRDEQIQGDAGLNAVLDPFMPTLFRLAARGHWIKEHGPIRDHRGSPMILPTVPPFEGGDLYINPQPTSSDVSVSIAFKSRDVTYILHTYPQIREFEAMLKALTPEKSWRGIHFQASGHEGIGGKPPRYQFQKHNEGVVLGFNPEQWDELKRAFATVLAQPTLRGIFNELSWIYGEL